jgi:hypothetical protein
MQHEDVRRARCPIRAPTVCGLDRLNTRVVLRASAAHDCTACGHEKLVRLALVGFARLELLVRYTVQWEDSLRPQAVSISG